MTSSDVGQPACLRILHLCLACFYIDGYSYQENLLPKYHKKAGHEVKIIASLVTFDQLGQLTLLPNSRRYWNEDGIEVVRLNYWPSRTASRLRMYRGLVKAIDEFRPDVIFAHGPQFLDGWRVARYVRKRPRIRLYVDNHADDTNSGQTWLSRTVLHKGIWRSVAQVLSNSAEFMFGVLPARVEYLKTMYKVPEEKVAFLPMGIDDDLLTMVTPAAVAGFRQYHGVDPGDLLIVTGGKIDASKRGTLNLMRAVRNLESGKVRLIVFGTVIPELTREFEELTDDSRITFVGWLNNPDSTLCFGAADLVVFPGRHSVYWEQVCAIGVPMMITRRNAMTHIDLGGNCAYVETDNEDDVRAAIERFITSPDLLDSMLTAAQSSTRSKFSYRTIAAASLTRSSR